MIFRFLLAIVIPIGCVSEVASQGESLYCLFSRASNLDDWEHLADDVANGAVNVKMAAGMSYKMPVQDLTCAPAAIGCSNRLETVPPLICAAAVRVTVITLIVSSLVPLHWQRINETLKKSSREDVKQRDSRIALLMWTSSLLSVLILLLAARRYYRTQRREQPESTGILRRVSITSEAAVPWSPVELQNQSDAAEKEPLIENHDPLLASLQIGELIGGGHFANVYRASSSVGELAVKVYHSDQKTFDNEYDNLTLLQSLEHPNIIQLIYAAVAEKRLMLQLYAGSLHSLLGGKFADFTNFLDCAIDITERTTHSYCINSGVPKSVIAHRDLNPNNILYSRHGSARIQLCIADFGLSISFPEGRAAKNLELLTERGTVRYMAVELLEGSVNLLDPMTSLLQTDVYSCALVLWELLWRCADIWPVGDIPSHRVAFDNLVPRNPRLEHMYQVVVRERRRPDIPPPIQKQKSLSNPT
ncbi:hypothetical protein OSTOST_03259, partial [Ostertagia ostertagi]